MSGVLMRWFRCSKKLEKMMSALSDAVAAVQAGQVKLGNDITKAVADLQAAIAASGNDSADVAAAVSTLGTIASGLQSSDAAVLAADPANAAPSSPAA